MFNKQSVTRRSKFKEKVLMKIEKKQKKSFIKVILTDAIYKQSQTIWSGATTLCKISVHKWNEFVNDAIDYWLTKFACMYNDI